MMTPEARTARLRGAREAQEPGARGIERVARNPDCLRLRALTIAGITPATAAHEIMGMEDREAQSPFALVIAQQFERHLLANGGANLFTLYTQQNVLLAGESKIASVGEFAPGDSSMQRQRREAETHRLLAMKLAGDPRAPNLILKPRLNLEMVGILHPIEPDFLVASDQDPFYRVGELKSYPDRGGKTDQADIRSACRQSAVGIVALRQTLARLGYRDAEAIVPARCDLILKVTGFFLPTLHQMVIAGELDSILRALSDAPSNLDELEAMLPPSATLTDPAILASIPNRYRSGCREHCALWTHCREQATTASQPTLLGEEAAEYLAAAGSLGRAIDLMNGSGAPPRNSAERALARELYEANQMLRRTLANG
jgi:hypothetical protein